MAADGSRRYGPNVDPTRSSDVRRRVQPFADALAAETSLDELALSLSAIFQPGLDLIGVLADIDQLAADCPTPTRDGVMLHLFGSGLFTGDSSGYHRWQNSCLDHVIADGRGMPITLAVLGIEVARRVGVVLSGVGMPGHFLVGDPSDPGWFADPFHGRTAMSIADCRELLTAMGATRWSDRFLEPITDRLVIARILNNLKLSCERRDDRVRLALVLQARREMHEFAAERADAAAALATFN
jgi:regulator of sirC expression with transglutaminase-like and TPR domain